MKISYCVTCCNEIYTLQKLLGKLNVCLRKQDEIVIIIDKDNYSKETEKIALAYKELDKEILDLRLK